tara:strand:- start:5331 stop:5807 length:477 start_codon:yes stop_codon:yes gene_type:complete
MNVPEMVRFDIAGLNAHLSQSLIPILGPGVVSSNFGPVLVKLIENALYPYTDYDFQQIAGMFKTYGIEEDTAREVSNILHPMIHRMVSTIYHRYIGECLFEVTQDGATTVLVKNLGFIPDENASSLWGTIDTYVDKMHRAMENGDYIPERMRRQAGLA